jgi:hypothetical protein
MGEMINSLNKEVEIHLREREREKGEEIASSKQYF